MGAAVAQFDQSDPRFERPQFWCVDWWLDSVGKPGALNTHTQLCQALSTCSWEQIYKAASALGTSAFKVLPCLYEHLALGLCWQGWALSVSGICNLSCPFWAVGGTVSPDLRPAGRVRHCQCHPMTALNPLCAAEIRSLISCSLSPSVLTRFCCSCLMHGAATRNDRGVTSELCPSWPCSH